MRWLLYGAMAVIAVGWIVRPFNDPDFFWHLKTGEWIWQHRELPARDPFAYTNAAVEPGKIKFTLQSYWLGQVLYHQVHGRWGIPGIVALKLLLAAVLVLALLKTRRGDPVVQAALALAALPLLFGVFPFDRPQTFSFVCFALLLLLLERERAADTAPSGWATCLAVPLLLLAWANMHGGHAVGQATIVLYLVLEGVKFAHPALRPARKDRYGRLAIAGSAGLAASLLSPNSWHALAAAIAPVPVTQNIAEYLSTVQFYRTTGQALLFIFWGLLCLAAVCWVFTLRKVDITGTALLAGTGLYGFLYLRHVPFFVIAAVPAIAAVLSAERTRPWAPQALAGAALVLAAWFSRGALPSGARIDAALRVNEAQYPVRAADFVRANDLAGNLYNTWSWGGYLLWRLAPERQVFVDGRGLNPEVNFLASSIALGLPLPADSPLYWRNGLRRYGIGCLIIPSRRGYFIDGARGLRAALRQAPEWVPVFADDTAMVYALNVPGNRAVIAQHAIPNDSLPADD